MLRKYLPHIYDENVTMLAIADIEQPEINAIASGAKQAFLDNFAKAATLRGIQNYERLLRIIPDTIKDTLEFRRARVINKLSMFTPYTKAFLISLLDNSFGRENYNILIDNSKYAVYLDVVSEVQGVYEQTIVDVREILPANMKLAASSVVKQDVAIAKATSAAHIAATTKHITIPQRREY